MHLEQTEAGLFAVADPGMKLGVQATDAPRPEEVPDVMFERPKPDALEFLERGDLLGAQAVMFKPNPDDPRWHKIEGFGTVRIMRKTYPPGYIRTVTKVIEVPLNEEF